MTYSDEIEEILMAAHAENIFGAVVNEVNKLKKEGITNELELYKTAIENVRRYKTI